MWRRFSYYDQFRVPFYVSESDEPSSDGSDYSEEESSCYDSDDTDDSEEESSCYDSDDESEPESESEEYSSDDDDDGDEDEEGLEELVVLKRMTTKKKRCATKKVRSSVKKPSSKKDVLRKSLTKKISKKKKGSLMHCRSSCRKKPAAARIKKGKAKATMTKPLTACTRKGKEKAKMTKRPAARSRKRKEKATTIRRLMVSNKKKQDLVNHPMSFLVFDLETTGLSRGYHRIIEIAVVDHFHGDGQSCLFQSLVNPGCPVLNSHVHGITTKMVTKPGVPGMQELIPILLKFVKSRQKPRGYVVMVAHNARSFDVPFLVSEFKRCSKRIPSNWLFLDTLPLAREAIRGTQVGAKLEALSEHYGIKLVGSAHRAMSDACSLSQVLHRITFDLNLSTADLVQKTFTARDLAI